jgi:hypothetical protein
MEVNGGQFKPTSDVEALVFYRLLKQQAKDRFGEPLEVAKPEAGEWLSASDSYRLFCAMERGTYNGMDNEPKRIMQRVAIDGLAKMAEQTLGEYQTVLDCLNISPAEYSQNDNNSIDIVIKLASQSMRR